MLDSTKWIVSWFPLSRCIVPTSFLLADPHIDRVFLGRTQASLKPLHIRDTGRVRNGSASDVAGSYTLSSYLQPFLLMLALGQKSKLDRSLFVWHRQGNQLQIMCWAHRLVRWSWYSTVNAFDNLVNFPSWYLRRLILSHAWCSCRRIWIYRPKLRLLVRWVVLGWWIYGFIFGRECILHRHLHRSISRAEGRNWGHAVNGSATVPLRVSHLCKGSRWIYAYDRIPSKLWVIVLLWDSSTKFRHSIFPFHIWNINGWFHWIFSVSPTWGKRVGILQRLLDRLLNALVNRVVWASFRK